MTALLRDPDVCEQGCGCNTRVVDVRARRQKGYIWRRHECLVCGARWTSWQYLVHPKHVNADDVEPAARAKVHNL